MNWKFRTDFQPFPGVRLSYGKTGIHTNILFPVTSSPEEATIQKEKLQHRLLKPYDPKHEIRSDVVAKLTSPDLQDFKNLLLHANASHHNTHILLLEKNKTYYSNNKRLNRLQRSIFKLFFKNRIRRLETETASLQEEIDELTRQINLSVINLEIEAEDIYADLYKNIKDAFQLIKQCHKKWDFTSSKKTNQVTERTSAANTVTRSVIDLAEKALPIIQTGVSSFCIHNINGGDIYLFPAFMLIYESKDDFALIDYTDIDIKYCNRGFIEEDPVPEDSKIIGHTWHKVNKDGSRDRRFASNYQIPIAEYGQISFSSQSGLNELYCFSNTEYATLFYTALQDYIDSLKTAKKLLAQFT